MKEGMQPQYWKRSGHHGTSSDTPQRVHRRNDLPCPNTDSHNSDDDQVVVITICPDTYVREGFLAKHYQQNHCDRDVREYS